MTLPEQAPPAAPVSSAELLRREEYARVVERAACLGQGTGHVEHHNVAVGFYKTGDWPRARHHLEEAIRLAPGSARSHYLLGLMARESGLAAEAVARLDRALELDPGHARAWLERGMARFQAGDAAGAAADLACAVETDPGLAAAWHNLGVARARLARWPEAREAFAAALRLEPAELLPISRLLVELGQAEAGEEFGHAGHRLKNRLGIQGDRLRGLAALVAQRGDPALAARLAEIQAENERVYLELAAVLLPMGASPARVELVDLHAALEKCLFVAARSIEHVDLARDYASDLPEIPCDERGIREAFLNLILNAAEAVPAEGGRLSIRTALVGGQVRVELADNGPGLAREEAARLFLPGRSRKPHGSGIGLAQTARTVRAHGGTIEGESLPGGGARFVVTLPVHLALQPGPRELGLRSALLEEPGELLIEPRGGEDLGL